MAIERYRMKEFCIHFSDEQLENLRRRIENTRMPPFAMESWKLGTDEGYLQSLLDYWRSSYDWHSKERELNQYPQFTCKIDSMTVHFFHVRSTHEGAPALLLAHGWPDSFLRYAKVFRLLSDYDLVVPSLPGFVFSTLPPKGIMNNAETAELWHKLMTAVLGYKEYAAAGGDMGRGVICFLAARYPQEIRGLHLTDVGFASDLVAAPDETLTSVELDYKHRANEWIRKESAYINIQGTKPQTLAYSLADSPAGLAAWIVEKYHAWSDWPLLTMDDICDCLTLYWITNTASTSIRAYHGNTFTLPPLGKISTPTAIAVFPHDVLPVPREWIEQNYPVIAYHEMARGGHFGALEQPAAYAKDIAQFMDKLMKTR